MDGQTWAVGGGGELKGMPFNLQKIDYQAHDS